jgi:integrase
MFPQAGILIQSSGKNPRIEGFIPKLDDDPALEEYADKVKKTMDEIAGLKQNTRDSVFFTLQRLNRETDLMNPEAVKKYIDTLVTKKTKEPAENATKQKIANNYDYFVHANNLQWIRPTYKFDTKIPITPTKEQAEQIISSAPTLNSATIFRILLESGFEGQELHNTTEKDIDTEQGIITVAGTKGHNGRSYKFKPATAEMLRTFIHKHHRLHPFPKPNIMGEAWREARQRASNKLSRPDLNKIPLKGLRNLSGIILWQKCHDAWTVMRHMGHKKLDTTQHYLSAMTVQQTETEWTSVAVQLGQPDTIKKIMELIDAGFTKETEADGYQIFRKPK